MNGNSLANFLVKGQIVKMVCFLGYRFSVVMTQLCCHSTKAAVNSM